IDRGRRKLDQFGMLLQVSLEINDAIRSQSRVDLPHVAGIDLPEGDRHIVDELAIAGLTRPQEQIGAIVIGCSVHRYEQAFGVGATRSPDGDEGIAQYSVRRELAAGPSVPITQSLEHELGQYAAASHRPE